MRSEDEIKARIAELKDELKRLRDEELAEGEYVKMLRIQGNIGALEWAIRKDA